METPDVKIDHLYKAKVTNKLVTIKILSVNPQGGWDALNTATGKKIRIKSAKTLSEIENSSEKPPVLPAAAKTKRQPSNDTPQVKQAHTQANIQNTLRDEKLSIIDAAFKVLQESDSLLSCTQMVEQITKADYWKPSKGGKTPANTLYAAILRKIKTKGQKSRFEKVGRGLFAIKK